MPMMKDMKVLLFKRSCETLRGLIAGRENTNQKLEAKLKGITPVGEISLYVGGLNQTFKIHADTLCDAVTEFLKIATPETISLAAGPKGGNLLGVNNKYIQNFYVYLKG